jgi:hypothetical protein
MMRIMLLSERFPAAIDAARNCGDERFTLLRTAHPDGGAEHSTTAN